MAIVALAIAVSKGWQLFLATLLIAPMWFLACMFLAKITMAGYIETMMAYNQSAGYAEQALAAIRVVVSFGFEKQEVKNYTKYLDQVHASGCKREKNYGLVIGFLIAVLQAAYAFSFWIGSYFIEYEIYNDF
jgi:ATP-binding cassette subfamily B (MDR/TAP) protein 1